jgi:hypothetical protein
MEDIRAALKKLSKQVQFSAAGRARRLSCLT